MTYYNGRTQLFATYRAMSTAHQDGVARTAGNNSAKRAAFARPLPHVQIAAEGNPNAKKYGQRSSRYLTLLERERPRAIQMNLCPNTVNEYAFFRNLMVRHRSSLETVISGRASDQSLGVPAGGKTLTRNSRIDPTHESKAYQRTHVRNCTECERYDDRRENHDCPVRRCGEHSQHSCVSHGLLVWCAIPML